jgi:transposase
VKRGIAADTLGNTLMAISKETEAEILRLHYAEKWRKGTIAAQLKIHHSTVERVLVNNGVSAEQLRVRKSITDPYIDFVKSVLKEYPRLNATRIFHMARERGYPGGVDWFRDMVARYRQPPSGDAHLRLRTLPGEQAQIDWASFGKIKVGDTERKLYAFVMTLSWSRKIFLRFYLNQGMANFQRGHMDAFEYFGNKVPRKCLYDNCKVVVKERIGNAIVYNPELLSFAGHYHFQPLAVWPAKPNLKGRVERGIRYVRSSFWGARKWKDLNDLNEQARLWCLGEADERRWVQDERICVKEAFLKECELMHPLVETAYPVYDRREVHVGKSQYVQFDCNFYSVPGEFARRTLSVFATEEIVRILDGMNVVAEHKRSFEKQKQIDDEKHIGDLIDAKRAARKHHGLSQLQSAAPSTTDFFVEAGNRGQNLGRLTQELLLLLKLYGSSELEHGIKSAFNAGRIHASAVRHAIQHERGKRGQQMEPVKLQFESNQLANELTIVPNSLEGYGKLFEDKEADL